MDWGKHGHYWSLSQLSRFSYVRPYNWHIQDTRETNKPIVLLLHGTGASTHSWQHLIPMLKSTFRVVAIDLPGHGFTKAKDHNRSSLNLMSDDILSLLGSEKIKPQLIIGHSAGAALAFRLVLNMKNNRTSVIAINGVLDHYFEGMSSFFFPVAAKALAMSPLSVSLIARVNQLTNQTSRLNRITGSKLNSQSLLFYGKLLSDPSHLTGTLAMMSQWKLDSLNNDLKYFKQKSLFLIGENDQMVTPKSLLKYAGEIKNSKLQTEKGLGHLMHEEAPTLIYKHIISFYGENNA